MFTYLIYFFAILSLLPSFVVNLIVFEESSKAFLIAFYSLSISFLFLFLYPLFRKPSKKMYGFFLILFIAVWIYYAPLFTKSIYEFLNGNLKLTFLKAWSLTDQPINFIPGLLLLVATWHSYLGITMKGDDFVEAKFFAPIRGKKIIIPYLFNFIVIIFFFIFAFGSCLSNIPA